MQMILLGTSNPSKIEVISAMLEKLPVRLVTPGQLGITIQVSEDGATCQENAAIKARAYCDASGLVTFSVDAALFIEGLNEEDQPGVYVRRIRGELGCENGDCPEVNDEDLMAHYIEAIDNMGGRGLARWIVGTAFALPGQSVQSRSFEFRAILQPVPSPVRLPGLPLSSLMIDRRTGRYFSETDHSEREDADFIRAIMRDFLEKNMDDAPITAYFPNPNAIIEPFGENVIKLTRKAPDRAVLCFFHDLIQQLVNEKSLMEVGEDRTEMGRHPVYIYKAETPEGSREILVFHPGVGAPLAVGLTEDLVAAGVRNIIACGGCGVLKTEIAVGHPVILTSAVRDEGTSYHYLPPSLESFSDPSATAALEAACQARNIDYRLGKSWTTDAYYRETPERTALRLSQGCDVVEMEASALFAMAKFRGIRLGQIVYGGDLVVPEGWDHRNWHKRHDDRQLMFDIAVDACLRMD